MDLVEIYLDQLSEDIVYEDEYMKVIKVLKDIPTGSKDYVKRVQLVVWKVKNTDIPDIDIRYYSKKRKKYSKGISLTHKEVEYLYKALTEYLNEI